MTRVYTIDYAIELAARKAVETGRMHVVCEPEHRGSKGPGLLVLSEREYRRMRVLPADLRVNGKGRVVSSVLPGLRTGDQLGGR